MIGRDGHNNADRARDVSVAIASYNGARFLPDLLDSILAQTCPPGEIVCSDDASTDDTVAVLERYASQSPVPIKIIRQETNIGVIENFLAAFRATTGGLIAYCDQDDVWLETKLESCVYAFEDEDVALVCHASLITDGDLNESGGVYYDIARDERLSFPGVSFKRHAWGHQMIFTRRALEILLALYRNDEFRACGLGTCFDHGVPFAASLAGDLHYTKDPQVKFRRHDGASSDAGQGEKAGAGEGVSGRLGARAAQMRWRSEIINRALAILDADIIEGARDQNASRAAYSAHQTLADKRATLAEDDNVFARAGAFFGLAGAAARDGARIRDFAADALTVVHGGARSRAKH